MKSKRLIFSSKMNVLIFKLLADYRFLNVFKITPRHGPSSYLCNLPWCLAELIYIRVYSRIKITLFSLLKNQVRSIFENEIFPYLHNRKHIWELNKFKLNFWPKLKGTKCSVVGIFQWICHFLIYCHLKSIKTELILRDFFTQKYIYSKKM